MSISWRWAAAGVAGTVAVAVALVITASAGGRHAVPSAVGTSTRAAGTGSSRAPGSTKATGSVKATGAEAVSATASPLPTVIATPPARRVRVRSGFPNCSAEDRPYPQTAPVDAHRPASLYFSSSATPGWRLDIPDLGIRSDFAASEAQIPVLLYARDFTNSDAGPHTATLTWPTSSTSGEPSCQYPFWLKRESGLTMTVTRTGATRRFSGRLTWTTFGPRSRAVGHAGQRIRIRYRASHAYVHLPTVTTDASGRYALTVPAGQHVWQATYAGMITANQIYSPAVTG